jgi:hypothetical protein
MIMIIMRKNKNKEEAKTCPIEVSREFLHVLRSSRREIFLAPARYRGRFFANRNFDFSAV